MRIFRGLSLHHFDTTQTYNEQTDRQTDIQTTTRKIVFQTNHIKSGRCLLSILSPLRHGQDRELLINKKTNFQEPKGKFCPKGGLVLKRVEPLTKQG